MRRVVRGPGGARSDPLPRSGRAPGHHLARGSTSAISGHTPKRRDAPRPRVIVDRRNSGDRTAGGFSLLCRDSRRAGPRGPARRLACGRPGYRTSGIGANPDRPASASGLVVLGLVPVRGDGDHGHLTRHLLQAILAAHTGRNLRHRLEAGRRDCLSTLLAGAVVAAAQTLQRLGETVGALHEQAPGGEIHLAILVHLDHVDFVGELARIAHSTIGLHGGGGPAHLADALHGPVQFRFQLLLDLIHSFLPLYGRLPCFNHLIRLAELGCKPCAGPFEVKRRVETPNIRGSNGVVPSPNRAKWSPTVGKMSPGPPIFGDLWGPELWMRPPEGRGKDWAPGKRTPAPARLSAPRGSGCAASLSRRGLR